MREFEYIADQNQPRPGDDIDPLELNDGRDHGQGGETFDQLPKDHCRAFEVNQLNPLNLSEQMKRNRLGGLDGLAGSFPTRPRPLFEGFRFQALSG